MDFEPDESERAAGELARAVLDKQNLAESEWERQQAAWSALAGAGLLTLALPAELDGDGMGVAGVTAILHAIGSRGALLPGMATLALGVLPVVAHGTEQQRALLLPGAGTGATLLTAAMGEPGQPLGCKPRVSAVLVEGGWRLDGVKSSVPYAAAAYRILVPATLSGGGSAVFLVDPLAPGVALVRTPSATGQPEYTLRLTGVMVSETEVLGGDLTGVSVHALRNFAVAGAVALGDGALAGALELTTEHVRTRRQFGKPLAEFQAVAQQVADVYIAARTVHLAAVAGCREQAAGVDAAHALGLAGYWLAETALPALRTCHHLHGGLGVDVTYPLHRYYSLLKDLVRFLGGRSACLEWLDGDSAPRHTVAPQNDRRFIGLSARQQALQVELRDYFAGLLTDSERASMLTQRHGPVFRDVVARMGSDGRLGVGWPKEYGGHGFGPIEQYLFVNEAARADVQLPSVTLQTVGPTLQAFGTEEQKDYFLPRILSGKVHFAIGYTEPEAGTDLAALRTTAVRDGDHYVVNGQKVFTTGGHDADYIWLAVRTDPNAARHKGISILIVDTRDPGFSWTPIITCDGAHHVNATYYSDVRVPVDRLVGVENGGWQLITTQLNHERVMLGPSGRFGALHDRVRAWAVTNELLETAEVHTALTEAMVVERINELLNWQVAAGAEVTVADASATKVFGSERVQQVCARLEEVVARFGDAADPDTGLLLQWLDVQAKRNLVLTFGGGVNEIQRELIAAVGLGLPRVPR